ncbi:MAG: hypothetical protein HZA53_03245 [Planctomycetes bacterium]|nr:hypothetical protein [Planctomycetota bacterium]
MSSEDTNDPFADEPRKRRTWIWVALAAVVLIGGAAAWWLSTREVRREEARVEARKELEPLARKLAEAPEAAPGPYDIDTTMRVLAELDRAARESRTTREWVERLARQDWRGVPKEVLDVRARVLDVLVRMAGVLGRVEEHDRNWEEYRGVLEAVEMANATSLRLSLGPIGLRHDADESVRQKARAELEAKLAEREGLLHAFEPLRTELFQALDAGAPAMRKVAQDWEALCLARDAAYLAAVRRDWEATARRAREAIERSPSETEAHLLFVLAQVEGDLPTSPELGSADALIDRFVAEHPDQAAPALLLRGVWNAKHGRATDARADFELAATRYPQQSARLADAVDPYAMRGYLRDTTQGRNVTGMYQALSLGAGWFSPELQLARLAFDAGDRAAGRRQVLEHFQRRRKGSQWSLVLYDVDFCEGLLGDDFTALFPEVSYLDLVIEPTTLSSLVSGAARLVGQDAERVLEAKVTNRSDRSLANAALVLCLRVTDMHPDDYSTLALPTQPAVPARTQTVFGAVELDPALRARGKTIDDLVEPVRAILLTDEAVFRIDSVRFKNDRIERYLAENGTGVPVSLSARLEQAVERVRAGRDAMKLELSATEWRVELPREVALLGPLFRLEHDGKRLDEALDPGDVENVLEGERVVLTFDRAIWSVGQKKPSEVRVTARNLARPLSIVFRLDGERYVVDRIE